jgi:hypothetical protein
MAASRRTQTGANDESRYRRGTILVDGRFRYGNCGRRRGLAELARPVSLIEQNLGRSAKARGVRFGCPPNLTSARSAPHDVCAFSDRPRAKPRSACSRSTSSCPLLAPTTLVPCRRFRRRRAGGFDKRIFAIGGHRWSCRRSSPSHFRASFIAEPKTASRSLLSSAEAEGAVLHAGDWPTGGCS